MTPEERAAFWKKVEAWRASLDKETEETTEPTESKGFLTRLGRGVAKGLAHYPQPSTTREWLREREPDYPYGFFSPETLGEFVADVPAFALAEAATGGAAGIPYVARLIQLAGKAGRIPAYLAGKVLPRATTGATYGALTGEEGDRAKSAASEAALFTTVYPAIGKTASYLFGQLRGGPTDKVAEEIIKETVQKQPLLLEHKPPPIYVTPEGVAFPKPSPHEQPLEIYRKGVKTPPLAMKTTPSKKGAISSFDIQKILSKSPEEHTTEEIKALERYVRAGETVAPPITKKPSPRPVSKPVKTYRPQNIITWLKSQGGIDYIKEFWRGELDIAMENQPALRAAVNKRGGGSTLDDLALSAYAEGWISEPSPQALLDAIEAKKVRTDIVEKRIGRRMTKRKLGL
ncbi:MAG: hypothetical protein ACUVUQ_09930 [Thermodesulfovibrionales bacterium]